MSFASILSSYATHPYPSHRLPSNVHLASNEQTVAIFDRFPKAKYHFLILPRFPFVPAPPEVKALHTREQISSGESDSGSGSGNISGDGDGQDGRLVSSGTGQKREGEAPDAGEERAEKKKKNNDNDNDSAVEGLCRPPKPKGRRLPRSWKQPTRPQLESVQSLLRRTPPVVLVEVVKAMRKMADEVVEMVRDEMIKTEGFEWNISCGFHVVPSIPYLHCHVISHDFISDCLKTKKHYNSFDPTNGFFLNLRDLEEMIYDWHPEWTQDHVAWLVRQSRENLAADLVCFKCRQPCANMPELKRHLEWEWDKLKKNPKPRRIEIPYEAGRPTYVSRMRSGAINEEFEGVEIHPRYEDEKWGGELVGW